MKVKYIGASDEQVKWGSNDDPRGTLTEGEAYEVKTWKTHTQHTKITLLDYPDLKFNSVCFEESTYEHE